MKWKWIMTLSALVCLLPALRGYPQQYVNLTPLNATQIVEEIRSLFAQRGVELPLQSVTRPDTGAPQTGANGADQGIDCRIEMDGATFALNACTKDKKIGFVVLPMADASTRGMMGSIAEDTWQLADEDCDRIEDWKAIGKAWYLVMDMRDFTFQVPSDVYVSQQGALLQKSYVDIIHSRLKTQVDAFVSFLGRVGAATVKPVTPQAKEGR